MKTRFSNYGLNLNHTTDITKSGYQMVILADLEAQERKFVANSRLKKAEKINFSWNLVPKKTVLLLPFFLKDPVDLTKANRLVQSQQQIIVEKWGITNWGQGFKWSNNSCYIFLSTDPHPPIPHVP